MDLYKRTSTPPNRFCRDIQDVYLGQLKQSKCGALETTRKVQENKATQSLWVVVTINCGRKVMFARQDSELSFCLKQIGLAKRFRCLNIQPPRGTGTYQQYMALVVYHLASKSTGTS